MPALVGTLVLIFGSVAAAMLLESLSPRRQIAKIPWFRWLNNFGITAINQAILFVWQPFVALLFVDKTGLHHSSLIAPEAMSLAAWVVVIVLSVELVSYWQHRLFHRIPLLWRIHSVHHSDVEVDASTAHRHHPLEAMASFLFLLPVFAVLNPPAETLVYVVLFQTAMAAFSHANVRLGKHLTSTLGLLIVTPDFHRVHHMAELTLTNSNYANCLPLFDWLFGTKRNWTEHQQESHALGLEYLSSNDCSTVSSMLWYPLSGNVTSEVR